jgi:enoyl-CoA hydratase/carnithine racemase
MNTDSQKREPVLYVQDGSIVTLTLNLPEVKNALTDDDMIDAIVGALARLDEDDTVRAAILVGGGNVFSSGGNLKKMGGPGGATTSKPTENRRGYRHGIQRIPLAFSRLEVPIIAAVNGPAIGAGCDLACMCDIRIAAKSARFAESFVKVGIIPGDGGAWLLPRAIGYARACEMALTGDSIDAQQALEWGLVSAVVPDDQLRAHAKTLAERMAVNPPHAVRMTKRLMRDGLSLNLEPLLEMSAAMQAVAHTTADHKEAVDAFLAKRAPVFNGN